MLQQCRALLSFTRDVVRRLASLGAQNSRLQQQWSPSDWWSIGSKRLVALTRIYTIAPALVYTSLVCPSHRCISVEYPLTKHDVLRTRTSRIRIIVFAQHGKLLFVKYMQ